MRRGLVGLGMVLVSSLALADKPDSGFRFVLALLSIAHSVVIHLHCHAAMEQLVFGLVHYTCPSARHFTKDAVRAIVSRSHNSLSF